MPAILRKSLTACEALPALPPTPRMKRRPPASASGGEEFGGLLDGGGVELGDYFCGLG